MIPRDRDEQGNDGRVVEKSGQGERQAHEAEEARGEGGPEAEHVLGRSVRQPRPLYALDHDEEGTHREHARVAETGQGVLCGDHARIPH